MQIHELKQYIHDNDKIPFILEELQCHDINYDEKQEYYYCCRPTGDNNKAVIIKNSEYLSYMSFTRGISFSDGQDLISFVEYIKGIKFLDAIKYLHSILNLKFSIKKEPKPPQTNAERVKEVLSIITKHICKRKEEEEEDIKVLSEEELDAFVPLLHIDWFREGISQDIAREFGICYSYYHKRIIVPFRYFMTGELVGWTGRTTIADHELFGITKYFISPGMQKGLNLYGLWENYRHIQDAGFVVVVESEKSVLKMASRGIRNVVALSGHVLSPTQIRILIGLDVDIVIAMDKDVDLEDVRYMCKQFLNIRKVYYIYDKWGALKDHESPCDKHRKVYGWLLSKVWRYNSKAEKKMFRECERKKKK